MGGVEWRSIPGFEGFYEASSSGEIRRVGRRVLRPRAATNGYMQMNLWREGRRYKALVHRLVASAFLGACPSARHQVNHRDAVKTNNAVANLEWVTPRENTAHARGHGRCLGNRTSGEARWYAKLTNAAVREIRSSKLSGLALAKKFGVGSSTIYRVRAGEAWRAQTN